MNGTLPTRDAVLEAVGRHGNNYEAVAFELDSDPGTIERIVQTARPTNGATRPEPAPATPTKTCADPECANEFTPGSGAQKYCKNEDCKRRRWAREKRQQTGHKPKAQKAGPKPPAPATARQEQPSGDLAGRYVELVLERATADLTAEEARSIIERLAGLGSSQ